MLEIIYGEQIYRGLHLAPLALGRDYRFTARVLATIAELRNGVNLRAMT
jgi:hypothetical protein